MDGFPKQERPAGDVSDFSVDEALQPRFPPPSSHHDAVFSTIGSSDMAHITGIDRNEYSDEGPSRLYPGLLFVLDVASNPLAHF